MRAIITGATGFVGANLARRLLADGHEVHLLIRAEASLWRVEDIRADIRLHVIDFSDSAGLRILFRRIRPDWVFHLAAYGAYSSQSDLQRMVQTNIQGTINLVEAGLASGFGAFVNTGSSSEYGIKDHPPPESELIEPNSYYAVTKASATLYCQHIARSQGVHLPTLRLYSVYGQYEEPTRLMPTLILAGLGGTLPPLVDPRIARDYVYIEDVCDAYLLAATRPGQEHGAVYNVGTGTQTSLAEVVEAARRLMVITREPVWGSMPNRRWDTTVWIADNRKIIQELGWSPRYSFEEGLRHMVNWFREQPVWVEFYRGRTVPPQ